MRLVITGLALLALFSGAASAAKRPPRWNELHDGYSYDQYLADFGMPRPVNDVEYAMRAEVFAQELQAVLAHNADESQLYRQGLNRFSAMTPEEKSLMLMAPGREAFLRSSRGARGGSLSADMLKLVTAPKKDSSDDKPPRPALDYRRADPPVLTAVKDQGVCGSCWSFATTESIEAHTALQTGLLFDLSMQQMVSCVPEFNVTFVNPPGANGANVSQAMGGCNGYFPSHALEYVVTEQNGKMTQEYEIPYQSYWDQAPESWSQYKPTPPCMNAANRTRTTVELTGSVMNPANDPLALETALFEKGPMITIIDVPQSFMAYEGGVYASADCVGSDTMMPMHAVQIVGYGHDQAAKVDYWIVRNSWAPIWGEAGYVRMLRSTPAVCGQMWYPEAGTGQHVFTPQTSCGTCGIEGWTLYPTV